MSARMKTMPYPVRIPKHLLELADLRAAEEQVDRSTALRQLLHVGAVTYVLDVLAKGTHQPVQSRRAARRHATGHCREGAGARR
jgi:hypothetical protein